jgi:F420-non-reducing hydrogenase iron-sulfur subunit
MNTVRDIDIEAVPANGVNQEPPVTVFVCANCARPGKAATSAGRPRPTIPDFKWPFQAKQIVVPCAGRIQPEHLLKTMETGADLVAVVACEGENCHYVEGSIRCTRRVELVRSILEEIGLGEDRLLLCYLPGSATEDMLVTAGKSDAAHDFQSFDAKIDSVRNKVIKALETLPPNPLRLIDAGEAPGSKSQEGMSTTNDRK